MTEIEKKEHTYQAFISYRHCTPDMEAAKRLQSLLEGYRPPRGAVCSNTRRISRVFRDQSELPTSGDLGADIRGALENSDYLIVICSEALCESRWCMEEISYFKSLHGGRTNRILPLLVSGEPEEVFPPQLRSEARSYVDENGAVRQEQVELEPLCADIRAESGAKSLRKLRQEFLRIAAPILGCGFDDLYRRHQRRKNRRAAAVGGAAFCAAAAFAVYNWSMARQISEGLTKLLINESKSMAHYAEEARGGEDTLLAMLLARSAMPEDPGKPERPIVPEAETALRSAVLGRMLQENSIYYCSQAFAFNTENVVIKQISEDESRLFATDFTSSFIYDLYNGMLIRRFDQNNVTCDPGLRYAVATGLNPDFDRGASEFALYEIDSGELLLRSEYPSTGAGMVKFFPDEKMLYIYDYGEHSASSVPRVLAAVGYGGKAAVVQGAEMPETPLYWPANPLSYGSLEYSPGGTYLVEYGSGHTVVSEAATGKVRVEIPGRTERLRFTADEKYITMCLPEWGAACVCNLNGDIVYIYVPEMDLEFTPSMDGEEEVVTDIQLGCDNRLIAVSLATKRSGLYIGVKKTVLYYWDEDSGQGVPNSGRYLGAIQDADIFLSPNQPAFYAVFWNSIKKYSCNTEKMDRVAKAESLYVWDRQWLSDDMGCMLLAHIFPQEQAALTDDEAVTLQMIDPRDGTVNATAASVNRSEARGGASPSVFFFGRLGALLTYTPKGELEFWDGNEGTCLWKMTPRSEPVSVCISWEGDLAAVAMEDGTVEILNAQDGTPVRKLSLDSAPLELEITGDYILAGESVFFLSDGEKALTVPGRYHSAQNRAFRLTPDGLYLAPGTETALGDIYDVGTGKVLYQPAAGATSFSYRQESGYLVLQEHTNQQNPSNALEVWERTADSFEKRYSIQPDNADCVYEIDSTGEYLSVNCPPGGTYSEYYPGSFQLYSLPDNQLRLELPYGPYLYSNGFICSEYLSSGSYPYLLGGELIEAAEKYLTSPAGIRRLTQEEKARYFITDGV